MDAQLATIIPPSSSPGEITLTQGTRVLLPDGSTLPGVVAITLTAKPNDIWRARIECNVNVPPMVGMAVQFVRPDGIPITWWRRLLLRCAGMDSVDITTLDETSTRRFQSIRQRTVSPPPDVMEHGVRILYAQKDTDAPSEPTEDAASPDRAAAAQEPADDTSATNEQHSVAEIRALHLMSEPLCRDCYRRGVVRRATDVDHIDGDAMNDEPKNRQSLCHTCHSRKTARENGGFGRTRKRV